MPSKLKGQILNRKSQFLRESKFKGYKNQTFTTNKNASITQRKTGGIALFTRNEVNTRKKLFQILQKRTTKPQDKVQKPAKAEKTKVFGKKKEQRKIAEKLSTAIPQLEGARVRAGTHRRPLPAKLRPSLQPGAVLIILAGKWAGKRVVFLKALPSGLLLVTGPFKLNKVPLRRVHPSLVIATSTKVDISAVKVPENVNDAFFAKPKQEKSKKASDADVFKKDQKKEKKVDTEVTLSDERKAVQQQVDEPILAVVKKTPLLAGYLRGSRKLSFLIGLVGQ
jgi:large subunit ribosomal protein L6e